MSDVVLSFNQLSMHYFCSWVNIVLCSLVANRRAEATFAESIQFRLKIWRFETDNLSRALLEISSRSAAASMDTLQEPFSLNPGGAFGHETLDRRHTWAV